MLYSFSCIVLVNCDGSLDNVQVLFRNWEYFYLRAGIDLPCSVSRTWQFRCFRTNVRLLWCESNPCTLSIRPCVFYKHSRIFASHELVTLAYSSRKSMGFTAVVNVLPFTWHVPMVNLTCADAPRRKHRCTFVCYITIRCLHVSHWFINMPATEICMHRWENQFSWLDRWTL